MATTLNVNKLVRLLGKLDDLREAWREFTGDSLAETARKAGLSRTDLNMLFGEDPSRRYPHYQRQLEATYGLEPYSLEPVVLQWKERCATPAVRQR
jgi:hypothetical protein